MPYLLRVTETVANRISAVHPDLKRELKAALREISADPYSGKALQEELHGFYTYRYKRYRFIYSVDDAEQMITINMFGHRRNVYELFAKLVNRR